MTNIVLLDNIAHADLHVIPRFGAAFGDAVNQLLVFPTEFQALQREYPILFSRGPDGALQAVAITGLDRDENLFLGANGWDARYIPAVQRRGPFVIGFREQQIGGVVEQKPVIRIDLDDPRVRMAGGEGQPVFLPHGGNAPYLEAVAGVLRTIHMGIAASAPMFAAYESLGLIEPVALRVMLSETDQISFEGYFTIGAERLANLDGAALERLNRAGLLAPAFQVIASLDNIAVLIERRSRRSAA